MTTVFQVSFSHTASGNCEAAHSVTFQIPVSLAWEHVADSCYLCLPAMDQKQNFPVFLCQNEKAAQRENDRI